MGFATVYCDGCGAQILGVEFEKGHAVTRQGKNYCAECVPNLPPMAPGEEERKGSTRVKRIGETRNTDIIRNLQSMGGHGNTTRMTHGSHAAPAAPAGMSGPAKVGALAGSLVVLAGIAFILTRGGETKPDTSKAREAYDRVVAMQETATARDLLDAARRAQREAAGSAFEAKLREIANEAQARLEKEEKVAKLEREMTNLLEEARLADDPSAAVPLLRSLATRVQADAPALLEKINAGIDSILQRSVLKILGAIDFDLAKTTHGLKRVNEQLDEADRRAREAGAAAKGLQESVAAKRRQAAETFAKAADEQFGELEKRVQGLMDLLNYDQAANAVTGFLNDYRGTAVESKVTALQEKVAKAKKEFDAAWISVNADSDWKRSLGNGKVEFAGGVITLSCEGAEVDRDYTRRIVLAQSDETWKEVEMEFEVYLEKNGGAVVLCQGDPDPIPAGLRVRTGNDGLDANRWWKCYVRVMGGQVSMGLSGQTPQSRPVRVGVGGVAFAVYPGGKLQLRNIRVRKLR
ncbi:MAG: hypothetical protein HUU15_16000 [Candidatus Brocadiae bacterium]|nr:hypothetical protein [Candidatus Brocadiia bacterium]